MYIKPEMEIMMFLEDVVTASVPIPDFDVDYGDTPGDGDSDDFGS